MRPARNAGFTLLEALLSVLLMGVIMTALATVTAQWLPSWDRGIARLHHAEALAAGLSRVVADISGAENVSFDDSGVQPIFEGNELAVVFVHRMLNPTLGTGLEVVRIGETSDPSGPVLVRSTASLPLSVAEANGASSFVFSNPVVMIRPPLRVAFSFAGPDRVWLDSWRNVSLPRAVRVTVRDAATSVTLAVSTSTLIHAELPARCMWAQKLAECPGLGSRDAGANSVGVGGSR